MRKLDSLRAENERLRYERDAARHGERLLSERLGDAEAARRQGLASLAAAEERIAELAAENEALRKSLDEVCVRLSNCHDDHARLARDLAAKLDKPDEIC